PSRWCWREGVNQRVYSEKFIQLPDGSAEMHCYQNDTDYEYLYWYRQLRGKDIQLVVYLVAGSATFEEEFKSGFQAVTLTEKQWSLTISSVQEKDEAVYLCAASLHSAVADLRSVTKTYSPEAVYCSDT
uniref:Ig-like domain-containing protein n=1 Tax=Seriola lalandi dorsalis TaxID=1841481 RepID=A0A3B4XBU6_SERLL